MAYKRPLSPTQSIIIGILWIAFVIFVLINNTFNLPILLITLISGVTIFYPIVKSHRERKASRQGKRRHKRRR